MTNSPDTAQRPAAPAVATGPLFGSVWILVGDTGIDSDYSQWNVAAYLNEKEANKHRDAAQAEARKVNDKDYEIRTTFQNIYDHKFVCAYTGTYYRVVEVGLYSAFSPNSKQ